MISEELLKRINELAKKNKEEGLTPKELIERDELRQEYLKNFRQGMLQQLASTKIIDPQGNDVTPEKLKVLKDEMKNQQ